MPSEPNPDAPENFWIGQYDAQQIADAIGMSWAQSVISIFETRMVNIADLCSVGPPSAPAFTTLDLANSVIPGATRDAALAKLDNFVNSYTWSVFCHYTDATPAHEPDTQEPPADLPPNLPGEKPDLLPDIWRWLEWMRRNFHPLWFFPGDRVDIEGAGEVNFPSDHSGDWTVQPMGVQIHVTSFPDFTGRSGGGEPAVHYELGWFSIGVSGYHGQPHRLQRELQIQFSQAPVTIFAWNLPPGVTAEVWPLYPGTTRETE